MTMNSGGDLYQDMVETEMEHKRHFLDCEKSSDYLLLSSNEKTVDEEPMVMEKLELDEDIDIHSEVEGIGKNEGDETPVYFEEALETCEEVTIDYNESSLSVPLSPPISPRSPYDRLKIKRDGPQMNNEEQLSTHLDSEDEKKYYVEEEEEEEKEIEDITEEDEETIATFVTAAGQQLALYAVEDSEDVFAVAVYDESGEPPTSFQFLMKSDVERLIGEGAVRTVKKPSQIKRQLLTTQPPVFQSKQRRAPHTQNNHGLASGVKQRQQKANDRNRGNNAIANHNRQAMRESVTLAKDKYSSYKESNSVTTYMMMNEANTGNVGQSESSQESLGSESEIVEQSTVQYILLDGDQSDSELTFDEIEATLQGLKFQVNKSVKRRTYNGKKTVNRRNSTNHKANETINVNTKAISVEDPIHNSPNTSSPDISSEIPEIEAEGNENLINAEETQSDTTTQSSLSEIRPDVTENSTDKSSQDISVESTDPKTISNVIDGEQNSINTLRPNTSDEIRPKIKRSRKQQLTSVNRGDSEIIIQPALLGAEEDSSNKKRGRRKKKAVPDPDYNPRPVRSKKSRKMAKNARVEIIEIDVDEEQSITQPRKNVIEITIDDGKEKGSSDKENEIIMVGDSDDEAPETPVKPIPPAMQCKHCSRNFRQKRALDTHSRVCPKLRNNIEKGNTRKLDTSSGPSGKKDSDNKQSGSKEYTCKVCNEKFDAVVVLARHARTEHQKKYRNKGSKSATDAKSVETAVVAAKESLDEKRVTRISQKKKPQSTNHKLWKSKKLNCDDCGRWFPSRAILAAHCLQHATKNSEKQIRRCYICKKLIKTRSLYIQHMKTHGRATRNTKTQTTVLQKKLRQTRQVTSKLTSVKKRGRPRKL